MAPAAPPQVSVVVAAHARPLRLLWLLNALEEQTLPAERWEVVVVHDLEPEVAERVLARHPLAAAERLTHLAIAPGTGSPARQRNLGVARARAELVAFTDDDCRPDPRWLERLVAVAERRPGAFVQGATRPDPLERDVLASPHVRTVESEPPNHFAQTCNILYPRALLERLGGFDEAAITGEDVDLAFRAREAGAEQAPAPDALVFHAVEAHTLPGIVRQSLKWRHLALQVKRHPELRRGRPLGVFWKREHLLVTLAAAGLLAARGRRAGAALVLPYVVDQADRRGRRPLELAVNALELPGQAARELAEVAILAAGSLRHRTLLL